VVTDPPSGIAFMGKDWDTDKGGRDAWVAWLASVLAECRRVLKPGGHALVWALPRTSGWTHRAIEDAGLDVRDCITHLFGSGFPKSLDVGKAIDRAADAEREVVGIDPYRAALFAKTQHGEYVSPNGWSAGNRSAAITAPATEDAARWDGWGTALKPSSEMWYLARKPLGGATKLALTPEVLDAWEVRRRAHA
jgi:SAM-dependent methyltransferase